MRQELARQCNRDTQEIVFSFMTLQAMPSADVLRRYALKDRVLPAPQQIELALSQHLVGQKEALRAVSVAVYRHYLNHGYNQWMSSSQENCGSFPPNPVRMPFGKSRILLVGPTGTGKTELVLRLSELIGTPFVHVATTDQVQTGYAGEHASDVLRRLIAKCNGDRADAHRGIIFYDEVDKVKRVSGETNGRDVAGEGVQQGMLAYLEGKGFDNMHTSYMLYFLGGAFDGIEQIVSRRLNINKNRIGFDSSHQTNNSMCHLDPWKAIQPEDLDSYGMLRELIGRITCIATLVPLRADDLVSILQFGKHSALSRFQKFFEAHGIKLTASGEALRYLANQALGMGTGVRGLEATLGAVCERIAFDVDQLAENSVTEVVITPEAVEGTGKPLLRTGAIKSRRWTSNYSPAPNKSGLRVYGANGL